MLTTMRWRVSGATQEEANSTNTARRERWIVRSARDAERIAGSPPELNIERGALDPPDSLIVEIGRISPRSLWSLPQLPPAECRARRQWSRQRSAYAPARSVSRETAPELNRGNRS